jgi:hypothetical protein
MKKLAASLVLLIFTSTQLFAWGPKGHQIIGDIARNHLTPGAKQNVQALLGNDDLASISTWADDVRLLRPETFGWHFVDVPIDAAGFSEERDCYRFDEKRPSTKEDHHNCVVDRIIAFKQVLADKNAPQPARLEALKFLVHFVGDIHQPLHAIEEARGGNDIHIIEFGSPQCGKYACNLHFEWDISLIEHTGRSEQEYVAYLERMIAGKNLQARAGGKPADWANESFRLAKQAWLRDGGAVDEAYYQVHIGALDERLALAGLRLAAMLNDVLGNPGPQQSHGGVN